MPATTTFPVYDPWIKETPHADHIGELRAFNQKCYALVRKVYERNTAAGKKGKEAFYAVGIHRTQPNRNFTFNLAMQLPKYEIFPRDVGAVEYAGAMGAAETLLNGEYRIASLEEEVEVKKWEEKARSEKLAQRERNASAQAASLMAGIANRVMGPFTPSPAGAKGK